PAFISSLSHPLQHHPHPDLHTLPTRRSSDLAHAQRHRPVDDPTSPRRTTARAPPPGEDAMKIVTSLSFRRQCREAFEFYARVLRSEEHTSELQSRENLVCRLLHEKKTTRLPA